MACVCWLWGEGCEESIQEVTAASWWFAVALALSCPQPVAFITDWDVSKWRRHLERPLDVFCPDYIVTKQKHFFLFFRMFWILPAGANNFLFPVHWLLLLIIKSLQWIATLEMLGFGMKPQVIGVWWAGRARIGWFAKKIFLFFFFSLVFSSFFLLEKSKPRYARLYNRAIQTANAVQVCFMECWTLLHTASRFLLSSLELRFMSCMALQDGSNVLPTYEMQGSRTCAVQGWRSPCLQTCLLISGPVLSSRVIWKGAQPLFLLLQLCVLLYTSKKYCCSLLTCACVKCISKQQWPIALEKKMQRMSKMRFTCWQLKWWRGSFDREWLLSDTAWLENKQRVNCTQCFYYTDLSTWPDLVALQ